jgi:hypothetical protein
MQSIAHVEPTPSPPAVAEAHPRDPRLVLHGRAVHAGTRDGAAAIAPDLRTDRAPPAWTWRCPFCLSSALRANKQGAIDCAACPARLPPPVDRPGEYRLPTEQGHPRWDEDRGLLGEWDRYRRAGRLLARWGRSTQRKDGQTPADDNDTRTPEPPVRDKAVLGEADVELDAVKRAYADGVQVLTDTARQMEQDGPRLAASLVQAPKRARAEIRREADAIAQALLDHLDELPQARAARRVVAPRVTQPEGLRDTPPWSAEATAPCVAATMGCYGALYVLVVNAILDRGIEYRGFTEHVAPRLPRAEPFGSTRAALTALAEQRLLARRPVAPGGAEATHGLPQGLVFNLIAVHPSHGSSGHAPGEDQLIDQIDAASALDAVRVGRRFESQSRYVGGRDVGEQVLVDPGRPLDVIDRALLELCERGRLVGKARRTGRTIEEAIERLDIPGAIAAMREAGIPGAAELTEKQARQRLKRVRPLVAESLRDRGSIPQPRPRERPPTPEVTPPPDRRRSTPSTFTPLPIEVTL